MKYTLPVFAIVIATVSGISAHAETRKQLNVPAIQINVTSSDGKPVNNVFVTEELYADTWGPYSDNNGTPNVHLGWHSTKIFSKDVPESQSSFVLSTFSSGSYYNPSYGVTVAGLAIESCRGGDGSYASVFTYSDMGSGCSWSPSENVAQVLNCRLSLTADQLQQLFQEWNEHCASVQNRN